MWLLKDRFPRNILQKLSDRILKTARALKDIMPEFEWKVFGDINPNFIERVFGIKHEEVNVRLMGVGSAEQIKENEQDNIIMGQRAREAALMRHDRAQIVDTVLSVYDEILNGNR